MNDHAVIPTVIQAFDFGKLVEKIVAPTLSSAWKFKRWPDRQITLNESSKHVLYFDGKGTKVRFHSRTWKVRCEMSEKADSTSQTSLKADVLTFAGDVDDALRDIAVLRKILEKDT